MGILCLVIGWEFGSRTSKGQGIPARTVGDYLHAVIESDRTFYTQHVVERMEAMLIVTASENWREEKTLPLPVQFLREASRGLHVRDAPFRYRLVSLWPLNRERYLARCRYRCQQCGSEVALNEVGRIYGEVPRIPGVFIPMFSNRASEMPR